MAIQELFVRGYRSFKELSWQPGALNLLVGPNASGKSNLLRLLELISATAAGGLERYMNSEGGIVPLLWDQQAKSIEWRLRIDPVDAGRDRQRDALTYHVELARAGRGSGYTIQQDHLGNYQAYLRGEAKSPYWIITRDARHAAIYDQRARGLVPISVEELPADVTETAPPNESLLGRVASIQNRIPSEVRDALTAWRIVTEIPVGRDSALRRPVTTQHAPVLEPDASNFVSWLHTLYTGSSEFKRLLDEGMQAGFGREFQELVFAPAASQQVQLAIRWRSSSRTHDAAALSDGTLRYLALLALLVQPEPPPLLAIDEPEVGLHPSMLPMVAECMEVAARRTQLVVCSHSAEFLDCLTAAPITVARFQWEAGASTVRPLPREAFGDWLTRYRLGEMFLSGDLENLDPDARRPEQPLPPLDLPSQDALLKSLDRPA